MIWVLRILFIILSTAIGLYMPYVQAEPNQPELMNTIIGAVLGVVISSVLVVIEVFVTRRFVTAISIVMFGVIFGFIVSSLLLTALAMVPGFGDMAHKEWTDFAVTFLCCYLSVVAIVQSKDDFKFVIPFIELSKEGKSGRPFVLDTSVIIDGRIADVCEKWVIGGPIILPRFMLDELQSVADSPDRLKRVRGRRGLDILNRMRKNPKIDIQIHDAKYPHIEAVDSKLITLTKSIDGVLVTNDFNLSKVATLQGVEIINLNDLATSLRPVVLPGEFMEVKIVKAGEEVNQGIGYLDDGTMVVVEGAYSRIGQRINVTVTSMLQTNAGRMIFGTYSKG